MNLTWQFSVIDAAIKRGAQTFGLTPFQARLLLAISDLETGDGGVDSADLEAAIPIQASGVRRALGVLYSRKLAEGKGGDGGPRRPGVRSRINTTISGSSCCEQIYGWKGAIEEAREAELEVAS